LVLEELLSELDVPPPDVDDRPVVLLLVCSCCLLDDVVLSLSLSRLLEPEPLEVDGFFVRLLVPGRRAEDMTINNSKVDEGYLVRFLVKLRLRLLLVFFKYYA
jgi:hypothetical protein